MALNMFSIYEFPTGMAEMENVASMFCKDEMPFAKLCANLIFILVGKSPDQFNGVRILLLNFSYFFYSHDPN